MSLSAGPRLGWYSHSSPSVCLNLDISLPASRVPLHCRVLYSVSNWSDTCTPNPPTRSPNSMSVASLRGGHRGRPPRRLAETFPPCSLIQSQRRTGRGMGHTICDAKCSSATTRLGGHTGIMAAMPRKTNAILIMPPPPLVGHPGACHGGPPWSSRGYLLCSPAGSVPV